MSQTVRGQLALFRGGIDNNDAAPVVTIECKNTSGGALARGDVVVWDTTSNSTADVISVTTTTSGNDVNVIGMVYDQSIAANAIGQVQIWGPTRHLKVDGNTDIAIGDMLSTFTTAKIAQKSTTGGRFARAMEGYTTNDSAGVIDAFITNLNLGAFSTE